MSNRRRRADDFTDSLRSFRQTFGMEHIQPVSEMYSEDSLDTGSVRNDASILPNNLPNEQHISSSDAYHTAEENSDLPHSYAQLESALEETSYMSFNLDLNKCINLFHNKHLRKEQGNASTETTTSSQEKVETIGPSLNEFSSESFVSSTKKDDRLSMEEDQKNDSMSVESSEDIDLHELKTLLHSLENQSKSPREAPVQNRTVRRVSEIFYVSPNDFTERLLTIIEESVVTNDSDMREFLDVSLCRLTAELRKMCKFIDNETVPEWPASPSMSTSSKSPRTTTTPVASSQRRNSKSSRKMFRRTPKTISAALNNTQSPMHDSTNVHDSTTTFECLEAYCKRLFPDEYRPSPLQKNRVQSPLQNMNSILNTCNVQMKSLEDSPSVREPQNVATSTTDSASQLDTVLGTQNLQHGLIPVIVTPDKHEETLLVERVAKQRARCSTRGEMIEPDELKRTLMDEIAEKRQRCLDTAKVIMEIGGDSELSPAQSTCPVSSVNETRLSTEKDTILIETLMSCKEYKEYLEDHKPLLSLLQRSQAYKSRSAQSKQNVKKVNKVNVATLTAPKLLMPRRKNSRSPSPKTFVTKPKLFMTPGKTPGSRTACKEKRTYFPNLGISPSKQENLRKDTKKSNVNPSTQSICRRMGLNYDSVVSPVGMYIKGTNPHLIKNLRPKTDEMLLTPTRKKELTPSTSIKPEMKFRLSPKQSKKTVVNTQADENVPDNFLHPKVRYKLPSHVRTIKETENRKVGNRMNELLRSTQDKVVIRHEGRTKTVQTDCLEQLEIHYDSAEESVHIEQTARKTHFSHVQKDH